MIKKLIIAGSLAGSMLVGVPAANASPFLCMQQYEAARSNCTGGSEGGNCMNAALIAFQDCLQRDALINQ
ncbi:hypothetical protein [Brevundimonas nasdae]|uniref:Uncharacterized protein n=1 Tax=Brevundimonas nasdae TaxID=172043 RepID=A0ABX8TIE0_9CAUL|nr:hypothetical protein [Brevundimonas nasdae]QYC11018.1 hypothetical protein KWG56_03130 [Brevundimonas nasdae]QYC13804.1 hypothetical protein KWG63_16680 [Brevundimonas nasdae]